MNSKNLFIFLALAAFCSAGAHAQSTLNAAGGSTTIGGNTYEFSVGEMTVVSTNTAGSITVTYGVLQPAKSGGTGIAAQPWLSGALNVFPNPASDELFIKPSLPVGSVLSYRLMDVAGRLVAAPVQATLHTGAEQQHIGLTALAAGNYMLLVEATQPDGRRAQEVFKINKAR